jgi:hypothetical protein
LAVLCAQNLRKMPSMIADEHRAIPGNFVCDPSAARHEMPILPTIPIIRNSRTRRSLINTAVPGWFGGPTIAEKHEFGLFSPER